MPDFLSVTTTVDSREAADRIATVLVDERLAACVQVEGPIQSVYRWKRAVERAEEWRCTIKTRAVLFAALEQKLQAIHPYETPEILAHTIVDGSREYLAWMDECLRA